MSESASKTNVSPTGRMNSYELMEGNSANEPLNSHDNIDLFFNVGRNSTTFDSILMFTSLSTSSKLKTNFYDML